jgi:hypothetical protein
MAKRSSAVQSVASNLFALRGIKKDLAEKIICTGSKKLFLSKTEVNMK